MNFVIYHNPRCRKSRETLAILEAAGVRPEVVLYLETPPSRERLVRLCELLGKRPLEITRVKESLFKELDLKGASEEALLDALAEHPKLMERPIVVRDERAAVLGRPPENVRVLLA